MKPLRILIYFFLVILLFFEALGQSDGWTLNQESVTYSYTTTLIDPPKKIEFLVGNYQGVAKVKYSDNIVTVSNIIWGGSITISGHGGTVNTTLEDAIFKKNGKLRPNWERSIKEELTKSIRRELSYYESS